MREGEGERGRERDTLLRSRYQAKCTLHDPEASYSKTVEVLCTVMGTDTDQLLSTEKMEKGNSGVLLFGPE